MLRHRLEMVSVILLSACLAVKGISFTNHSCQVYGQDYCDCTIVCWGTTCETNSQRQEEICQANQRACHRRCNEEYLRTTEPTSSSSRGLAEVVSVLQLILLALLWLRRKLGPSTIEAWSACLSRVFGHLKKGQVWLVHLNDVTTF